MKTKFNRGTENRIYLVVLITGVVLFSVFFTSKSWMYDDSAIAQTAFNESIGGLSQTNIMLRNWEYNPKNQLMEVTLETVHIGTDAVEPTFSFKAEGRESNDTYPAKKVFESGNKMIIQIKNVPDSYKVIGLFVTEHRDEEILKQEYEKQLKNKNTPAEINESTDGEIDKSKLPEPEDVIIVGDYRKINTNKSLVTKSNEAYKKETIISEMNRIKNEISSLIDESIPFQEDLIKTLKIDIDSLKEEMQFETKSEQLETEKDIEQKENAIQDAEDEIKKHQEKIKELEEKYKNSKEKLESLTQTKEEEKSNNDTKKDEGKHSSKTQKGDENNDKKNSKKKQSNSKKKDKSSSKPDKKSKKEEKNKQ